MVRKGENSTYCMLINQQGYIQPENVAFTRKAVLFGNIVRASYVKSVFVMSRSVGCSLSSCQL